MVIQQYLVEKSVIQKKERKMIQQIIQTSIHGHIPVLANDARVSFDNYEAKFTREEPGKLDSSVNLRSCLLLGFIRSLATVHATVSERGTDRRMKMVVDEQIHYKECAQLVTHI